MERTTVTRTVIREHIRPSKTEIRKRIHLEKCIATGVSLAVIILSALLVTAAGVVSVLIALERIGTVGGEILVIPAIVLAFYWGYEIGETSGNNMQEDDFEYEEYDEPEETTTRRSGTMQVVGRDYRRTGTGRR